MHPRREQTVTSNHEQSVMRPAISNCPSSALQICSAFVGAAFIVSGTLTLSKQITGLFLRPQNKVIIK